MQNQNQFSIKPHGKLPNSCYFDICTKSVQDTESITDNRAEIIEEHNELTQNELSHAQMGNISIWSCVFSPDYNYMAWSCGHGLVKVMKCKDSEEKKNYSKKSDIFEIQCSDLVWSIAFGSSKSYYKHCTSSKRPQVYHRFNFDEISLLLAIGLSNGRIRIYDGTTGHFLFALYDHKDLIRDLKFSKDGSLQLASVSKDETIKLWNMYDDGNMYKTLRGHSGMVYSCDWSPTDSLLCSVGSNRQTFIWNINNFTLLFKLKEHLHDVVTCEFSPDGAVLATGSYDTTICLWSPHTGQLIKKFFHLIPPPSLIYAGGHNGAYVRSLRFSVNGDHLVSISDDKKIRIWSIFTKGSIPLCEESHRDAISLAYSSSSRSIMIGTRTGIIEYYEVKPVIPKLMFLCRKVVNQFTPNSLVNELCLPNELKKYLLYEDLRENSSPKTNLNFNTKLNVASNTKNIQATIAF